MGPSDCHLLHDQQELGNKLANGVTDYATCFGVLESDCPMSVLELQVWHTPLLPNQHSLCITSLPLRNARLHTNKL